MSFFSDRERVSRWLQHICLAGCLFFSLVSVTPAAGYISLGLFGTGLTLLIISRMLNPDGPTRVLLLVYAWRLFSTIINRESLSLLFLSRLYNIFFYIPYFFLINIKLDKKEWLRYVPLVLCTTSALLVIAGMVEMQTGTRFPLMWRDTVKEGMFLGVFNHHNNSGFFYTILTLLPLNLFLYENGRTKWVYLFLFSLNVAGHFITFSRSYLIGLSAGSLLSLGSFVYFSKGRRLWLVGVASVLVVAIFIIFSQYKPLMLERLSMILTPAKEEGIVARFYQWKVAGDIFREHPVTGLGYVRFGKVFRSEYLEKYRNEIEKEYPNLHEILFQSPQATRLRELKLHFHSLYLTELARSGLIGLVLIFGFHVMMLLRFFRFLLAAGTPFVRAVSAWALFASVGVLTGEFFDYSLDYSIFIVTFSFMQGFACLVFENLQEKTMRQEELAPGEIQG